MALKITRARLSNLTSSPGPFQIPLYSAKIPLCLSSFPAAFDLPFLYSMYSMLFCVPFSLEIRYRVAWEEKVTLIFLSTKTLNVVGTE
jgi:hypothetical protein